MERDIWRTRPLLPASHDRLRVGGEQAERASSEASGEVVHESLIGWRYWKKRGLKEAGRLLLQAACLRVRVHKGEFPSSSCEPCRRDVGVQWSLLRLSCHVDEFVDGNAFCGIN